jgi:hypothetical protein
MRSAVVLACVSAACAAGCHAQAGSSESVRGVLAGVLFVAQDGYATQSISSTLQPPPRIWSLDVVLTDYTGACATASTLRAGGTTVQVSIVREGERVAPGTYGTDGGAGLRLTAILQRTDAACQLARLETASAASVTIDVVEGAAVRGTLSLRFPDGVLSGNFVAPYCDSDAEAPPPGDASSDASAEAAATCGP